MEHLYHIGKRLVEERNRLGLTQEGMAAAAGISKRAQGSYERDERSPDSSYWTALIKSGVDVQFVLTGVRSKNLDRVADEAGTYKVEKGVGTLSREEEVLVEKYRHLKPGDRTRAQAIFDALATTQVKKKDTG